MIHRNTRLLLLTILLLLPAVAAAEEEAEPPADLLGACTEAQLDEEPFSEWYREGFDGYRPNPAILEELRGAGKGKEEITIFFGTWCGDSRREVPRMLKLLDEMGFPDERVSIIGVGREEGLHKRSPDGEERGMGIYRVPTFVVHRGGEEVARLVEYPVLSLERDLLAILDRAPYEPNYRSFPVVRRWFEEGLLSDENVSARGLANEVRGLISTESELASAARVMLDRGDVTEAVKLHEANCSLHRDSALCYARLAEAYLAAENTEDARAAAERALRLNESPDLVEDLIALVESSTAPAE